MIKVTSSLFFAAFACLLIGCKEKSMHKSKLELFAAYYSAVKEGTEDRWNYTTDTVKLWFDDKTVAPILQIRDKGATGKWKEWDEVMNTTSNYDTIWFDPQENSVRGYFYEDNDFYQLIGKAPTKTLRTYWMNENEKISEILMYWIPEENTETSEHLAPIAEWALENDSLEISELYPNGKIIPSKENAFRWKKLLNKYNESQKAN